MAEFIFVTEDRTSWFLPLLPEPEKKALLENPQVYAIGAVEDECACGVLMVQETEDMAQIRYLIVADDYRRKGIGTGMVKHLCRYLYEDAVLLTCPFAASGNDDPIYKFFKYKWNFSIVEEEGYYCRVPLSGLKENELLTSMEKKIRSAVPFFFLTGREQRAFRNLLIENGVYYLQDISEDEFVKELCLCSKAESGKIVAAVFVTQESGKSDLELAYVWGSPGGQKDLMGLFGHACSLTMGREEGYLNIAAVTDASVSMVEKIFPEREIAGKYYEAVWSTEL